MRIFYDLFQKPCVLPEGRAVEWRVSGYALVGSAEHKVLLVKPGYGESRWVLPGGGIDPMESIQVGVERECHEETGYKACLSGDLPFYVSESPFFINDRYTHSLNLIYLAHLKDWVQEAVKDTYETEEVCWVPLHELNEENVHHIFYPAVRKLQLLSCN